MQNMSNIPLNMTKHIPENMLTNIKNMSTLLEICRICNYSYMQNMSDMQYIHFNMSNDMQNNMQQICRICHKICQNISTEFVIFAYCLSYALHIFWHIF